MNTTYEPTYDVLLNVRKAYRLLHDYQCMVRDAVRYISAQLDIPENAGWPQFAGDAIAGYRYLKQPSWDWLPMMGYEFHFVKPDGAGFLSLSFFIISDTGFIQGDDSDKEKLSGFAKADESSTKFAFILYKIHHQPFRFMEDKIQMRNFIENGSLPAELKDAVGKCYDISCLTSEAEANKVVNDILTKANEKHWPLEHKRRPSDAIQPDPHLPAIQL
jgi:hypothetical protein